MKSKATYKIVQDTESFLDANLDLPPPPLLSTPMKQLESQPTPQKLQGCAELDGKRMASNISEVQTHVHNSITEQSQSQQVSQFGQGQLNEVSTMLSHTSKIATTPKLVGNRQLECHQCRTWKRINAECRNYQLRVNYKDLQSVLKYIEELASIESLQKMAPELSRSLIALKDNFKCQYEVEKGELDAKVCQMQTKLENMKSIAEKYKANFDALQAKYDEIHKFIYDSRLVTIKKDANHQAFLKDKAISDEIVNDAQDLQSHIKYSALDTELNDLVDAVDIQREHHKETMQMLYDRQVGEKRTKGTHININDIFDREAAL